MPKRKRPASEPGHKERFDALFAKMVKPQASAPLIQTFDCPIGSPTVFTLAEGDALTSSTTTQEQIDAYIRAVNDGTYWGL